MKNKLIASILTLALICSSAFMLVSADSVKLGDVNGDGTVNATDARLALRAAAFLESLTDDQKIAADVNFDNRVNASDARTILRVASKLEKLPELPSEEVSSDEETSETETTTAEPPIETTTVEPEPDTGIVVEEYPEAIGAFFAGSFYLDASMGNGDAVTPMKMAANKSGTEIVMSSGEAQLSLLVLKNTSYLKAITAKGDKYYVELTKALTEQYGIDFNEVLGELSFAGIEDPGNPVLTKGMYNDEECDIYTFSNSETTKIMFYAVEEEIVYISVADETGAESTGIIVNELSSKIPSTMLTVRGFKETSILMLPSLMPEIMG